MKVEIWSDVVCPFCYIGKRKFEKALEGFAAKDKVEIEWKSFQLDPEMDNKEGLSKAYYTEGKDLGKIETMVQLATELGLDEAETRKVLEENVYAKEVLADQRHAYEIGVQGVPFFICMPLVGKHLFCIYVFLQ